jgi:hypothetical protein
VTNRYHEQVDVSNLGWTAHTMKPRIAGRGISAGGLAGGFVEPNCCVAAAQHGRADASTRRHVRWPEWRLAVVVSAAGVGVGRCRTPAERVGWRHSVTFDELMKPGDDWGLR